MWPDFAPMGERLRDYGILSAVMHNPIAPQEPWFAGFPLNYYLNWYRIAALVGAIGFAPWEIYHLLGPATMGLGIAASALLIVTWARVTPLLGSLIAVSLWLGSNVAGAITVYRGDHNWWGPSRVITGSINEFPAWSWILGDLHPHYLNLCALPFILLLTKKLNSWPLLCALFAWCAWNYSANAWDAAPALVVTAVILVSELFNNTKKFSIPNIDFKTSLLWLSLGGLFIISSLHIDAPYTPMRFVDWRSSWQPYFETAAAYLPVTIEPHAPGVFGTQINQFFLHWGFHLALLLAGFGLRLNSWRNALVFAAAILAVCIWDSVALFLLIAAALVVFFNSDAVLPGSKESLRSDAVLISCLLILLIPEILFFDDPYGGESERMNTIFKFYSFAWIPFGISAWIWLLQSISRQGLKIRSPLQYGFVAAMLISTLPWTAQTIGDRAQGSVKNSSLFTPMAQGLAYFERTYPGSERIIYTLAKSPRGTTIEAENGAYADGAFVSTLASQPTYLGWANHVGLLLKNPPELGRRQAIIKEFYTSNCERKLELLRSEGIKYVVFGEIERRAFPQLSRDSFSCLAVLIEERGMAVFQALVR